MQSQYWNVLVLREFLNKKGLILWLEQNPERESVSFKSTQQMRIKSPQTPCQPRAIKWA